MNTIRIACEGKTHVPLKDLKVIQGNLKTLTKKRYKKLRRAIEDDGFSFAIHVWVNEVGERCVLDGTQRVRTLEKMVSEGWFCPDLPVVYVEAASLQEAAKKLLHGASSYGRADEEGLMEFLSEMSLSEDDLSEVALAGLDTDDVKESHGPHTSEVCEKCGRPMPF